MCQSVYELMRIGDALCTLSRVCSICMCIDYQLRQVSHLQPAIQRHCQQLVPCHHCPHHYPHQQWQQQQHHFADDDVTLCECRRRHRHAVTADTCTVVKLADRRHCHDDSDDVDDHDDDGECVSPTWQRRSDVDIADVTRTADSVDKCQPSSSSSSLSSSQLPSSNDRQQILTSLSLSQNVLVNSISSENKDNHVLLTRS